MKALHVIAFILAVVGALNWGLVGAGGWNVVEMLLGSMAWLERLVYVLVGLSGLVLIFTHRKECKHCETKAEAPAM
ncbi:MAG: DUF378 domain-containing protein [Candidatus Taylorbacteria bacterium]|nr:DUF378 domain-containing protein [Candidatus Taylorbacteria bacterium]